MKPLKKNPLILFILCCVITGIVEYVIGFIGVYFLHIKLWDYSGLFLNVQGIICFRSIVSFAVMGVVFHYWIEPFAEKVFYKISMNKIRIISAIILGLFIVDCIFSALFRTPITY